MTKGTRVVITFGPFTGFEGTILSGRKGRVALLLQLGKRLLQVELDEDMVRGAAPSSNAAHSGTARSRPTREISSGSRVSRITASNASPHRNGSHKPRGSGKPSSK